jgi:hypothetical protein
LICPKCGNYQPDRAKYCGICGEGLSQDGLVESFLKQEKEHEITLPRHRSFFFYLVLGLIVVLVLALLAGGGYVVYRVAWGEKESDRNGGEPEENAARYENQDIGFRISYPDNWTLEEGLPAEDELAFLTLSLTDKKKMEIRAYQLDPIISIGGIEAIENHLAEDATGRIEAMGGQPAGASAVQPNGEQPGYGLEEPPSTPATEEALSGEMGEATNEDLFTSTKVSGLPAFYTEYTANVMGEETELLLYYVVAGDYIFLFQGRAPAQEYEDIRPQFYSITGSFEWQELLEEQAPDETPGVSTFTRPVIIFN